MACSGSSKLQARGAAAAAEGAAGVPTCSAPTEGGAVVCLKRAMVVQQKAPPQARAAGSKGRRQWRGGARPGAA